MRRILILADDLSGAADCANACMSSNLNAVVTLEPVDQGSSADIVSVDCDTRHLAPPLAAERVRRVMRSYTENHSACIVFKKVDSTLRGNVGAELQATLQERRAQQRDGRKIVAVMAPAFPEGGRTTESGCQIVHGVPLHETEMWTHNELQGTAHVPTMLEVAGLKTTVFHLNVIRSGVEQLAFAMSRALEETDVFVCDAYNDDDLSTIAHAAMTLGQETVWAGSAGLAHHLPPAAEMHGASRSVEVKVFENRPLLFVIGSMSSVSRKQASLLEARSRANSIHISPHTLLAGGDQTEWRANARWIEESLRSGTDTIVVLDATEKVDMAQRRSLTDALGVMLASIPNLIGALVATGGETARAILEGWNIPSLHLVGEIETGLPYSILYTNGRMLPVFTKAGAFGDPETLVKCWEYLKEMIRGSNSYDETRRIS